MRIALACASLLVLFASTASAQTLRRPVACDSCIANWFYFDNNGGGAGSLDWNCGSSSYDGHRGSDFSLRGGLGAIDTGHDVVAAADGVVVSTQDGHFDRCTTCNASVDGRCGTGYGFGYGNHVVVNHGEHRVVYAHLRTGSVRVAPGATVRCGDVLGQIGSSGCSTGAHLHFEVRPLGGSSSSAYDPFAGGCSSPTTRWTDQGAYRGLPAAACDGRPVCPAGTYAIWTCDDARTQRRRCIDGVDMIERCPYGCVSMPVGTDDVCADPPDADGDGARADVDCDDGDPSRRPGATETCGDGVDQDCDGTDLACPDAGMPALDGGPLDAGGDRDASAPRRDGGSQGLDASPRDAGPRARGLVGGCACRAGARRTAVPWALVLVLGALVGWRRASVG
jgi:hypothetical protein